MEIMALTRYTSIIPFSNFTLTKRNALPLSISSSDSGDSTRLFEAAKHTVDLYVENGMVIGLGSGRASALAIQYLGRKLRSGAIKDVVGIPKSVSSASEAAKSGVPLDQYNDFSKIDLAFNDADVVEEETISAIIGSQTMQCGESLIQEKTILKSARKLVLIVRENQYKGGVDGSIPVLINPINWLETAEEIGDLFLGDAEVWRRPSVGYAGPLGGDFPLVNKEGHNVLDVIFTSPILSLVADILDQGNGMVEYGIISRIPYYMHTPLNHIKKPVFAKDFLPTSDSYRF